MSANIRKPNTQIANNAPTAHSVQPSTSNRQAVGVLASLEVGHDQGH